MQVLVLPTATLAARTVATFVARALRDQPDSVLGLPTGRTVIPVYRALAALHRRRRVDFRRATTFNLDEFIGLPAGHRGSFEAFMRRHLFDAVNVQPQRIHFPNSIEAAPAEYDELIAEAGGLDLCLLGIGSNGHLGFNEPGNALAPATHRVRLLPATRRANTYLFSGRLAAVPRSALSMGIGTILNARVVLLLATGRDKTRIVRRALAGPVTTRVPASLIQTHPNALVVLDRAAAAQLSRR